MKPAAVDQLLTIPQAADKLEMSTRYVYDRIAAGDLPTVQLGAAGRSVRRIPAAALAEFIANRTTGAKP